MSVKPINLARSVPINNHISSIRPLDYGAAVSEHSFYKRIQIGPFEQLARDMILAGKLGEPDDFGSWWSFFDMNWTPRIMDPFKERCGVSLPIAFILAKLLDISKLTDNASWLFLRSGRRDAGARDVPARFPSPSLRCCVVLFSRLLSIGPPLFSGNKRGRFQRVPASSTIGRGGASASRRTAPAGRR